MTRTVLVCDDEKPIVRLLQVNLERHGYRVVAVLDGEDCLRQARAEHPDLILLDVMMPRLDGLAVLEVLKRDDETREIPVILVSVKSQYADVVRGWKAGADCYWPKPFDPEELMAGVDRLCRPRRDAAMA